MRTESTFKDAELRHFEKMLRAQRRDLDVALGRISTTLDTVLDARNSGTSDDEHDPEGPTLTMEWSRMSGVKGEFAVKSATVDRALERIKDGSYGLCIRCGEAIGRARLDARPAAELCIDCARKVEAAQSFR